MAVYLVGQLRVKHWDWYAEYKKVTETLVEKYSGKYLVKGGKTEQLEGNESLPSALVVIEFPTTEHARQWYRDPEYKPMIELRNASEVETTLLLVEGVSA